ncbi:uncharacterized protein LOC135833119 isoform X2 [Planococcus citri]|uniref:uncharacterized protein LOC135833119 isoform X2 n=1 Tax=Planococcus citri TaxID=170843 RepID=UPI0031FA1511
MLVMENGYHRRGPSSTASPSILDSPTLARVERARLRHEQEEQNGNNSPLQYTLSSYCPSLISMDPGREIHALKKGLLWQQRERLFSRWKERYFILTRDYLHCFKRSSSSERISNMGQFIFKVKLVEVEKVEWVNKKSYSTVALVLQDRDYRILLRTNEGLEDWFELLEECTVTSKERRKALHKFGNHDTLWSNTIESSTKSNFNSNNIDNWLLSRTNPVALDQSSLSDSVPDLQHPEQRYRDAEHLWRKKSPISYQQRLSLLTDIDINNCDSSIGTPSIQSTLRGTGDKRYSNSACYNRSIFNAVGSFRNSNMLSPTRFAQDRFSNAGSPLSIKYRDRSHSDAYTCKTRNNTSNAANRCSYISQQPANV